MDHPVFCGILFLLSIPSIPLYLAVLCLLFRNRHTSHYRTTFFRILFSLGVVDLLWFCFLCFFCIFPMLRWNGRLLLALNGTFIINYMYLYGYVLLQAQILGNILLAAQRYLAVCRPESKVTKYIETLPWWSICLIHYSIPMLELTKMTFQYPAHYEMHDGRAFQIIRLQDTAFNTLCALLIYFSAIVFCSLCYSLIWRRVVVSRNVVGRRISRGQLAISLHAFSLFVALCAVTVSFVLICIAANLQMNHLVWQLRLYYYVCSFLLSFVNPWMLLMTSRQTRILLVGCQKRGIRRKPTTTFDSTRDALL